jgi:hypothetical protein
LEELANLHIECPENFGAFDCGDPAPLSVPATWRGPYRASQVSRIDSGAWITALNKNQKRFSTLPDIYL